MKKEKDIGNVGIHTNVPEGSVVFELKLFQEIDLETDEIIKKLSEMYPETVTGFKEYMLEEFIIFCKKQYDYGPGNISVGTQLKDDKEIMISLKGLWFRINDKAQRLFNLILVRDTLKTTNESVEDAFLDLSVYGKIARLVMSGKWSK
jgi:HD superfamily phosphohydrolase